MKKTLTHLGSAALLGLFAWESGILHIYAVGAAVFLVGCLGIELVAKVTRKESEL